MTVDLSAATTFLYATARVLERRRFAHLFQDGPAEPVIHALRAFRNPDGGFAHAIEPDMRSPLSQPVGIHTALEILHEVGAHDDAMIGPAGDWLMTVTRPDGAIPFVLESAMADPHAPWWQYADEPSLIQTAINAAAFHALGAHHPWLDEADEYCFREIAALDLSRVGEEPGYALTFGIAFLDAVPDADRAEATLDALAPGLAPLRSAEPEPSAERPSPLGLSPRPGLRSRRLFDEAVIERHLDALEAAQEDDGGWNVSWPQWNDAAAAEWRGIATLLALKSLRANNRI